MKGDLGYRQSSKIGEDLAKMGVGWVNLDMLDKKTDGGQILSP